VGEISLDDILIAPLACIPTAGGNVLHALKQDDIGYSSFGEAYFSWVEIGVVKGWKRHTQMTMNLVVPVGNVRFVFCMGNAEGYRTEEIGIDRYMRLTVPPGIWFSFQGRVDPKSLVLNIASIQHDPNEAQRLELSEFEYDWS